MPYSMNPMCPDYSSHYENAYDRMFPAGGPEVIDMDTDRLILDDAEVEYLACEGHGCYLDDLLEAAAEIEVEGVMDGGSSS